MNLAVMGLGWEGDQPGETLEGEKVSKGKNSDKRRRRKRWRKWEKKEIKKTVKKRGGDRKEAQKTKESEGWRKRIQE